MALARAQMPGMASPRKPPEHQGILMNISPPLTNDAADRLAVVDTLYRFAAGIDLRDRSLLSSALAENVVSDFRPAAAKAGFEYPVIEGRDFIIAALTTSLETLDTTHL
jgi:hypothetical protein